MTLLLVIISVTNIAIGYWLGVHLGHTQVHWASNHLPRSQPSAEQPPSEATLQDDHDIAPAPVAAAEPPVEPPIELSIEPVAPEPVQVSPVSEAVEPTPIADEAPAAGDEESPVPAVVESVDVAVEEEVLNTVEEVRAEIHDQPAPATIVEALTDEAEPERSDSAPEEEPAKSKPVSKEALLESIGAFQEQLKKQREMSKLHPATSGEES